MGLSRLENFLKNARGNILYVSPNDLDSTDSIDNKGNSLTRPFKTIQRALVEASRFSYQRGLDNDRFGKTTILLYPGEHAVDNRPGWIPTDDSGSASYTLRDGTESTDFSAWDLTTVFDLNNANNALYKLNSVHGGVIVPRGTSLVGLDLRKTKIRPKYVPSPTNTNIERSALFRVTGECYFWQFSVFDADPNGDAYVDYTANTFLPNFSHHKLTTFEYADGVNNVDIKDAFLTYGTDRTDLQLYYEKVGLVYGTASGREIQPDYPSSGVDIQPKVDEYRIVGSTGKSVGISSIKAGDGTTSTNIITVTTTSAVTGLDVDTPIRIAGLTAGGYNGQYVVSERTSSTIFKYEVQNAPVNALPSVTGSTVALQSDTVTSSSPYIFNCSLRSVYGMCGLYANGANATGFKSMVVAQFTGIGLQKDDNAFILYNSTTGVYDDSTVPGNENLSTNSRAVFKPTYANYHIKCDNKAVLQLVSIIAIGYANHFVSDTGGDQSITNSNSNFGAQSLSAVGFRDTAFSQDDLGYVTHVIPPKQIPITENAIEFNAIDIGTTVGIATTNERLYLYDQSNFDAPPENVLEGYRVGARDLDDLVVLVPNSAGTPTEYKSRIVMPESQSSSEKLFNIDRSSAGINSITSNIITLTENHTFANAESVRVLSDNGRLPDGLDANTVYFVITSSNSSSGLTTTKDVKLAKTETDAKNASALTINNLGGSLKVVSRVSDKNSGEIGHPIQWDSTESQWYIKVSTASTDNAIQPDVVVGLGTTALGAATPRSYIKRKSDNRNADDTAYRLRYIIPASSGGSVARPPIDGFILQESNTSIGSTNSEIETYFGSGSLSNVNQQRNFRFIANANWSSSVANILTELPHDLSVNSRVQLVNIKSGVNTTGAGNSGYNGTFYVSGITSAREFTVGISTSPGAFENDTLTRNTDLPYFTRKDYKTTYFLQDTHEIQKYIQGEQDGIYYLTILNSSNAPVVSPFTGDKFTQPITNLYPQTNRDTPVSDPDPAISYAVSSPIGQVVVDNVEKSLTKETLNKFFDDIDVGVGLTDINTSVAGTSHIIHTSIDHGLNRITKVSIASSGTQYGTGVDADYYNAKLVAFGSSVTGENASAKVGVDATGGIISILIMDGGSAYGVGNTLAVVGIATTGTTGHTEAVIQVTEVYDNVGDVIRISGVTSDTYNQYNSVYRITTVDPGFAKSFTVYSDNAITGVTTTGIGTVPLDTASSALTGESIVVSNIAYNTTSGLATVTTTNTHGLKANAKVKLSTGIGGTIAAWDGDFIVKQNVDLNNFILNIGIGKTDATVAAASSMFALREGVTSNSGTPTLEDESLNGRMVPTYAGITTTLSAAIADAVTTEVRLTDVSTLGIEIGDYLAIDNEIVRIKGTPANPATNPLSVFRAVLGTRATTHSTGSLVRRIKPYAVELRRHSINRASGHTWEYVGYGPGNYSTALPDKQDRDISDVEELLAQSTRKNGGVNYFTGMNDRGISYAGNKKLSTVTGREEVFDTPLRTVTGEDISNKAGINLVKATDGTFTQSIRVDGGDEGKAISEFTGPVVFSNKVTSTASNGIEANSVYIQGDSTVSRKYTVGIATPTTAGTPGDVVYYENPEHGKYLGWVYTANKDWKRFGNVSLSKESNIYLFDQVGVGTTTVGTNTLRVGAGASLFNVDNDGVGIGTEANGKKLWVEGDTNIKGNINYVGVITATQFSGSGANITNINASATGWTPVQVTYAGAGNTGVYAYGGGDVLNSRVGIGTSIPTYNLELGMDPSKYITTLGYAHTDLYVHNRSTFIGTITSGDIDMSSGRLRNMDGSYQLYDTGGLIYAGVTTSTTLVVGSSGTAIQTTSASYIGFGTATPRSKVDIDGRLRIKSMHENVQELDISSGNVNIDLDHGQTFNLLVDEAVSQFTVLNPPDESTAFTIKITQNGTGYSVGIDTFKTSAGAALTVFWPGGGVLPVVTQTANKTDIYSFKSIDGCSSLFGIVGGQNFA